MIEVIAHELRLLAQPTRADAEEEAPAAEEVERGDLLGQDQRVPLRHEDDARAELDAARHAGGAGEGHEGVDEVPIAFGNDTVRRPWESALRVHGNEGMLGAPEGLEAQLLDFASHEADVDEMGGQGYGDADIHDDSS